MNRFASSPYKGSAAKVPLNLRVVPNTDQRVPEQPMEHIHRERTRESESECVCETVREGGGGRGLTAAAMLANQKFNLEPVKKI